MERPAVTRSHEVESIRHRARNHDPRVRDWVARALGDGARVVGARRLAGGITSAVHQLAVETPRGTRIQVVLRRWMPKDWSDGEDGAQLIKDEARVLHGLASTDIPAPRLLASDIDGEETGIPSLLMTRVPGRVDLAATHQRSWLRQLATMAVRIHDLDVHADTYRWEPKDVPVPAWASRPELWRAAGAVARDSPPPSETRFAHGDFQHFNLLWQRGRMTGVVDWPGAFRGPADVDIGHCRLNLAVLFSAEWAADFLAAYEADAGRRIDPYWDIRRITSVARSDWGAFIPLQVRGRVPFDRSGMHRRVEELLAAALARA